MTTQPNNNNSFELLLMSGKDIVVQRNFYVRNFNEKAKRSLDLYYEFQNICDKIEDGLKIRTINYLVDNPYDPMNNDDSENVLQIRKTDFLLSLKHNNEVFIERLIPAYFYHPKARYVDIRHILEEILGDLVSVLSKKKAVTKYLQYDLSK